LNILINGTHEYGVAMKIHSYGNDSPGIRFSHSTDAADLNKQVNTNYTIGMYHTSTDRFAITRNRGTSGWGTADFVINSSGNIGIGTVEPAYNLDVNGDIHTPTTHAYFGTLGHYASTASTDVGGLTWQNHEAGPSSTVNANDGPTAAWWYILRNRHTNTGNNYYTDLAIPFNNNSIYYKVIRNNAIANSGWVRVLDALNYNDYSPTKTGGGASGSWGISVTGSSASCTGHAESDLALSGGNMTGKIYSSATRILQWTTSDTDNNADGASWYGLGKFTPSGDNAWICLSNYWGISFRARDTDHVKINDNVVLNAGNYTSYTVTKTGSGASGTWGISITGNADTVDNYHASDLWRKDGGTWNGNANITCNATANGQEWSFDMSAGSYTGTFWHVWSAKKGASCLQCFNDDRHSWAYKLYGAVWNDYAEFRRAEEVEYGRVVIEDKDKKMKLCNERLAAGAKISSDTFGISIGKSDEYNMPIAVSGRVLAFPY
jgi:hypothetical protein